MGCKDCGEYDLLDAQNQINKLTEMLCNQCRLVEIANNIYLWDEEVLRWWATHKELDKIRKEKEIIENMIEREKKIEQFHALKTELGF